MRRSVLVATPDLDNPHASARLDHYPDLDDAGSEKDADQRLSAFLRTETPEPASGMRRSFGDTLDTPNYSQGGEQTQSSTISHAVSRSDVRASAEKILYTYLLRGAEREIVLPDPILQSISNAIEVDGRIDPEVFEDAKDYVFQAMERDAFPGFLRSKALGNLVPSSVMLRLVIGLIAMFGGFWAAFALIFLDIEPRTQRLWLILPFTVGVYCLIAHQYSLDPIMGLAGISEYTFCNFMRVRERYIRRLLIKRSLWILALTVALGMLSPTPPRAFICC